MTIKEIEEASGMLRANIRFYESEGFLHPEREKNGYRNYTEADLEILKKIKLLRSLHISLEEIKAMHNGEQELGKTLEEHIVRLTKQQEELEKSKYVCEKMQRDGVTYEKLNTEQYLRVLRSCCPDSKEREEWIERDIPEPVQAPFARMFARGFDYVFYMLLWIMLVFFWHRLMGLSRTGIIFGIALSVPMVLPLALLLEPLFLRLLGATPGKLLLGLRVVYELGGPIPKDVAWARTWRAVCMFHDWQYRELFQIVRIFETMDAGKTLAWDYMANTTIELKDRKCWRRVALAIAVVLCLFGMKATCRAMEMLPNRGDVTAAEFAENYNVRIELEGRGGTRITESGEWEGKSSYISDNRGYYTATINGESHRFIDGNGPKKIDIKTENGIVTEVGFFYETVNKEEKLSMYEDLMADIAMTFIEAEENYSVFSYKKWPEAQQKINAAIGYDVLAHVNQSAHFDDFSYRIGASVISCDVELRGYELWNDRYVAKEGVDTYYSIRFSVKKAE